MGGDTFQWPGLLRVPSKRAPNAPRDRTGHMTGKGCNHPVTLHAGAAAARNTELSGPSLQKSRDCGSVLHRPGVQAPTYPQPPLPTLRRGLSAEEPLPSVRPRRAGQRTAAWRRQQHRSRLPLLFPVPLPLLEAWARPPPRCAKETRSAHARPNARARSGSGGRPCPRDRGPPEPGNNEQ